MKQNWHQLMRSTTKLYYRLIIIYFLKLMHFFPSRILTQVLKAVANRYLHQVHVLKISDLIHSSNVKVQDDAIITRQPIAFGWLLSIPTDSLLFLIQKHSKLETSNHVSQGAEFVVDYLLMVLNTTEQTYLLWKPSR